MALNHSPLYDEHVALDAKLVPFGGWEMPLAYPSGTIAEHRACREAVAMFDVSHLGTVRVTGPGALANLQYAFTNDLGRVEPGRAQYTHLLGSDGSVLDDIIVWWHDANRFDVMPEGMGGTGGDDDSDSDSDDGPTSMGGTTSQTGGGSAATGSQQKSRRP